MAYTTALKMYLSQSGVTQSILADSAGLTQAAISRYASGRLPTKQAAEAIHAATNGEVAFALWQQEQAARIGVLAA